MNDIEVLSNDTKSKSKSTNKRLRTRRKEIKETRELYERDFVSTSNKFKSDNKFFMKLLYNYSNPSIDIDNIVEEDDINYYYSALKSYIMNANINDIGEAFYVDRVVFNKDVDYLYRFLVSAFKYSLKDLGTKEIKFMASIISSFKSIHDKVFDKIREDEELARRICSSESNMLEKYCYYK